MVARCPWCEGDELDIAYHDAEWGVPVHDDRKLFECLTLEGAQAGLSWRTILHKRDNYRRLFDNFDIATVAGYDDEKLAQLIQDPGIVRNRLKLSSTVGNARLILELQQQHGSFSDWLWGFVDHAPIHNQWQSMALVPATTALSDTLSKTMKKMGFRFVGSTICYAYMQAIGMVNDHLTGCHRHAELTP